MMNTNLMSYWIPKTTELPCQNQKDKAATCTGQSLSSKSGLLPMIRHQLQHRCSSDQGTFRLRVSFLFFKVWSELKLDFLHGLFQV